MNWATLLFTACTTDCKEDCIDKGQCIDPANCPPTTASAADVQKYMETVVPAGSTDGYWRNSSGTTEPWPIGALENHDGTYDIVARRPDHSGVGFVIASDGLPLTATSTPKGNNEEYFCGSAGFSWPQFLGSTLASGVVEWTVMPMSDAEPLAFSCRGAPVHLDGTFNPATPPGTPDNDMENTVSYAGSKSFFVQKCDINGTPTSNPKACPAAAPGPHVPPTGGRAVNLLPGVYDLKSSAFDKATRTSTVGQGTLHVRPVDTAANPNANFFLETYCVDANFGWPRFNWLKHSTSAGTGLVEGSLTVTPVATSTALTATPLAANQNVTCPGGSVRYDYCYTRNYDRNANPPTPLCL